MVTVFEVVLVFITVLTLLVLVRVSECERSVVCSENFVVLEVTLGVETIAMAPPVVVVRRSVGD